MEEVAAVAHILTRTGIISALEEHVRFARARFGTYDTIDFVIVLLSYALSGEPTLKAFYDRLAPFRDDVAVLFQRHHLPSRSALSRFLAALDEPTIEALRTQFLHDLFERATPFSHDVRNEMRNSQSAEKYAFLRRKNTEIPHKGGIYEQYDGFDGDHPDLFALGSLTPFMVWRGGAHHRASAQAGCSDQTQ